MEPLTTLVNRAQAGDLDAYGAIVHRFQDMAVGYAYSVLGDFHLAEDASQEAFISAYLDLPKLRKPEVFPGWFRRTVFKYCDRLTRGKQVETVPLDAVIGIASLQKGPDEVAEVHEMMDSVQRGLSALPEAERAVTALFYISGYSQKEIGAFLEIPVTTVKNRLRTARNRLKKGMVGMMKENLNEQRPSRNETFGEQIMDDLVRLSQRDIQVILKETEIHGVKDLAVVLKGNNEAFRERIFENMSERLGRMVREEMAFIQPEDMSKVEEVQTRLLETAKRLEQSGQITWPPEPSDGKGGESAADYGTEGVDVRVKVRNIPVSQFSFEEITEVIGRFANNARRVGILVAFKEIVEIACDDVLRLVVQLVLDGYEPGQIRIVVERQIQTWMHHHRTRYRMILEGVRAVQAAEHPRIMEQNLRTFYVPVRGERGEYTAASVDDLKARLQKTPFSRFGCDEIAEALMEMSIIARAANMPALEEVLAGVDEKLLVQGLQLAIEGREPEAVQNILERRMQTLLQTHETQYHMICEGMMAIQNGEHPRVIEQKVKSFYE